MRKVKLSEILKESPTHPDVDAKFNQRLKEYDRRMNPARSLQQLRDIVDDYMMDIEIMIDEKYGQMDAREFKKLWYDVTTEFDKKIQQLTANIIDAYK